jgi:hypothetical protein
VSAIATKLQRKKTRMRILVHKHTARQREFPDRERTDSLSPARPQGSVSRLTSKLIELGLLIARE